MKISVKVFWGFAGLGCKCVEQLIKKTFPVILVTLLNVSPTETFGDVRPANPDVKIPTFEVLSFHSPPYTSFLLNGDIELNRNRQLFVENIL